MDTTYSANGHTAALHCEMSNGHTTTLYCEMSTVGDKKPRTTTSKDLLTVNATGTGHNAYSPASRMKMMNFPASQQILISYDIQKFIKIYI